MPAATITDLRTYLGAGAGVTDAALTDALGSANDAVAAVLKSGTDMALPAVKGFVLAVAAQVWRNTSAGGTVTDYGDMTVAAGAAVNSSLLRRYYVLAMPYMNVAGWVG